MVMMSWAPQTGSNIDIGFVIMVGKRKLGNGITVYNPCKGITLLTSLGVVLL